MKKFKFRWFDKDGTALFRTIELPDDAAIFIGKDEFGQNVYEGDCISVPNCFWYGSATIGVRFKFRKYRLRESAFTWQKKNPEYFFGSFTKPEPPPKCWVDFYASQNRRANP